MFADKSFSEPIDARQDRTIDFVWELGDIGRKVAAGEFAVRWIGKLHPPAAGEYKLIAVADDGVRLWLDGKLLIDGWRVGYLKRFEVPANLQQRPYTLRLDYFSHRGDGLVSFRWQPPGESEEVVPAERLTPAR